MCPQASIMEAAPQLKFRLPLCIKLITKTNHHNMYEAHPGKKTVSLSSYMQILELKKIHLRRRLGKHYMTVAPRCIDQTNF